MRHVAGGRIGRTDFFRNAPFLRALVGALQGLPSPRVLVHAAATGAEPYSIVMAARIGGLATIAVDATDIEPSFLEIAKRGVYEEEWLAKVPTAARKFFLPVPGAGTVEVDPGVRAQVRFMEPASVVGYQTSQHYDAVLALNALPYVPRDEQHAAITSMGQYTKDFLCVTAASPVIVKLAIEQAGFEPLDCAEWLGIYYGWRDRIRLRPGWREWALPVLPYLMQDWRYSASTIFRRRPASGIA